MDPSPLIALFEQLGLPMLTRLLTAAATAAGGPAVGSLAALLVNVAAAALGVPGASPADLAASIAATPDKARSALQKVEEDHAAVIADVLAQARLDLDNVEDARRHEVALATAGSPLAWGAPAVATVVVAAFSGVAALVVARYGVDSALGQLIVGALISKFGTVVDYYLGASKSAADRLDQLVASLHPVGVAAPAPAHPRSGR